MTFKKKFQINENQAKKSSIEFFVSFSKFNILIEKKPKISQNKNSRKAWRSQIVRSLHESLKRRREKLVGAVLEKQKNE